MQRSIKRCTTLLLATVWGALAGTAAFANPQGANVVSGNVSFGHSDSSTLNVTNSPGSIINWQAFNIGAHETTRFIQQSAASAVLNRVTGGATSELLGSLLSNGRVFLINPQGILVGRDAVVDTAGLVLSTLDMSDDDFRAGRLHFASDADSGDIVNHGYIKSAPGGAVVLLAPRIVNAPQEGNEQSGLIQTEDGQLILAAGQSITITSLDDGDITFDVQAPEHEVVNLGQLLAQGGMISVLAGTIRHSGEINADTLGVDASGRIVLSASASLQTSADSVITANSGEDGVVAGQIALSGNSVALAPGATLTATNKAGVGGNIDVTAVETVEVGASLDATGASAGGTINITGDDVQLAGARLVANAENGDGGTVNVGGELQGGGDLATAATVVVDDASWIEASAIEAGEGGRVVVWSDDHTLFEGTAAARGGLDSGDGGLVEVSGKQRLDFVGAVDVGAPGGRAGTLLLDPQNITIIQGGAGDEIADDIPAAGDRFGSSFSVLGNGNILVMSQDADTGGLIDAGEIHLFDPTGELLNVIAGNAAGEKLGSLFFRTVTGGNLVFRSPDANNGALTQAGAVLLVNVDTGLEIGRSSGLSSAERFGATVDFFGVPTGTYLVRSPNADPGGVMDAGRIVLVDNATGLALGETAGSNVGDMLGSSGWTSRGSGNFVLRNPTADPGGILDAGSVYLINGTNGTAIGRINGNSASERLGEVIDFFTFGSNDFLIRSRFNDVGGNVDAGTIILAADVAVGPGFERGRVSGSSANELLGASSPQRLSPSNDYVIRSTSADIGGNVDAGSVILVDRATGTEKGRVDGTSAGEFLGNFGINVRASGNYVIRSTSADPGGIVNAGSVILASGTTGNEIGRFDGDTANEQFGGTIDLFSLGNADFLVRDAQHGGGAGIVAQIADVDLGGGNIRRGGVDGVVAGDNVGNLNPRFLPSRNYIVPARNMMVSTIAGAGSVFVVDNTTGNVLTRVDGDSVNELLGNNLDTFTLGGDNFAILSRNHAAGGGAVFFVDGSDSGSVLGSFTGSIDGLGGNNDQVGQLSIRSVAGGILVPVQFADPGGIRDAGSVFLVDTAGTVLGQSDGVSIDEFFGGTSPIFLSSGNYVIRSRNRDVGMNVDAGSVVLASGTTGNELGRIDGTSANEPLGSLSLQQLSSGDYIVRSANADIGMNVDAGSVILASGTTGMQLGRVDGISASERLGSSSVTALSSGNYIVTSTGADIGMNVDAGSVILASGTTGNRIGSTDGVSAGEFLGSFGITERASGNYVIRSRNADPGGIVDAGSIILASGTTGSEIGRVDGDTASERFGNNVNFFSLGSSDFLVFDPEHGGGAGIVAQIADVDLGGGNILRGSITGANPGDQVGNSFGISTTVSSGANYVIAARNVAVGGNANAGSVFIVDRVTANVVGRVDGSSAGELFGSIRLRERSNGNLVFQSPNADPGGVADAGSLLLTDPTGTLIGQLDGNNMNERLGSSVNFFSLGSDMLVQAPLHSNGSMTGAGGIFVVADTDLGGGNILRGSTLGTSMDEGFGSISPSIFSTTILVRSPNADVAGNVDAGAVVLLNRADGTELGRTSGISAGELFGNNTPSLVSGGNYFVRSPNADAGGLVDAGSIAMIDGTTGNLLGRTNGGSAGENFGSVFPRFISGHILVRSPNADVSGLADAGSLVQISNTTGLAVQVVSGISANERFGATTGQTLVDGRILFTSPDADINGVVDAGRMVFFDPTKTGADAFSFANLPADQFTLTNQTVQNFMLGGGTLILQANSDINIDAATVLTSASGSLTLQAGRSINIDGIVNVANLTLIANEVDGVQTGFRGGGTGDITITGEVIAGNAVLNGDTIIIQSASPSFVLSNGTLEVNATTNVKLLGGVGEGSIAALIAQETLTINSPRLELFSGSAPESTLGGKLASEIFDGAIPDITTLPGIAFTFAGTESNINVDSIFLQAGSTADSFVALVSNGQFNVAAGNIQLVPGTELNTDAVFLALGGAAEITFTDCIGCEDLFADPLVDPLPDAGIYIAGLFRNPAVEAILALVSEEAEATEEATGEAGAEGVEEDEEAGEDESTSAECN